MLVPTDRDVMMLANLSRSWRRQYLAEVARLIKETCVEVQLNADQPQQGGDLSETLRTD